MTDHIAPVQDKDRMDYPSEEIGSHCFGVLLREGLFYDYLGNM